MTEEENMQIMVIFLRYETANQQAEIIGPDKFLPALMFDTPATEAAA